MPRVERATRIVADPAALRRALLTVERWPVWSGFLRKATPAAADGGPEDAWSIVALLGEMPFSGIARLSVTGEADPPDGASPSALRATLATLTSAAPVQYARYSVAVDPVDGSPGEQAIRLRVEYGFARGPGGWLVERFLVRRHLPGQLDAALAGLTRAGRA